MAKPVYSNSQVIQQIDSGIHWNSQVVSFGFPTVAPAWSFNSWAGEGNGFTAFTAEQAAAARLAIGLWDDLAASSFVEQANGNSATIQYANSNTNVSYAHAYYPGSGDWSGTVWLNPQAYSGLYHPDVGTHYFQTLLHETGHALGLRHPGDYGGSGTSYENDAVYYQDSYQYTVMSYFSASNTGAQWYGSDGVSKSAQTPMVHDVLTIQSIYGADTTTRSGDTVYGFGATADRWVFDFGLNPDPVVTIYDAGGTDTLNLSGWSIDATIDLEPGSYSSGGGFSATTPMIHNIGIAYGTWIENATGGSGDDLLQGNLLANELRGQGGNDDLRGGDGDDTLIGGDGSDTLAGGAGGDRLLGGRGGDVIDGGDGIDWVFYNRSQAGVQVDLGDGLAERGGDAEGDWLTGIERVLGSDWNDQLSGDAGHNMLKGRAGGDLLQGGDGRDTLIGGSGADTLDGGADHDLVSYISSAAPVSVDLADGLVEQQGDAAGDWLVAVEEILGSRFDDTLAGGAQGDYLRGHQGDDRVSGGGGSDTLLGGDGGDTIDGGDDPDWLLGQEGDDRLEGGAGNDRLWGDPGADTLDGGDGRDWALYSRSDAAVQVDLSDGMAESGGYAAGDVLIGIEWVLGSDFGDFIRGDEGNNVLRGRAGDDTLSGGDGRDILRGDGGDDLLSGGAGDDTFKFLTGFGSDRLIDLDSGDTLSFIGVGFSGDNNAFLDLYGTELTGGYRIDLGTFGELLIDGASRADVIDSLLLS